MEREIVYLGRDNRIDLLLLSDNSPVDLSGTTHVILKISGVSISSVGRTDLFDWSSGTSGELRLKLGGTTISLGAYKMGVIVYNTIDDEGIHFGDVPIQIRK